MKSVLCVQQALASRLFALLAETEASSPVPTEAATPMTTADIDMDSPLSLASVEAAAGTPLYADGVPRDALGIPLITPATVTVARGGHRSPSPFGYGGGSILSASHGSVFAGAAPAAASRH